MSDNSPYETPDSDVSVSLGSSKLTTKEIFFSFEGRVPRKVFWLHGVLGAYIGTILLTMIIAGIAGAVGAWLLILIVPIVIGGLWATLAIFAKRWHDRDKSAWWILIGLVPIIGLWQIIECGFLESSQGDNRFGSAPEDY